MTDSAPVGFVLQVGIDVSAQKASVAWVTQTAQSEQAFEIPLSPAGMADLGRRLLTLAPDPAMIHVTMEITGNYHSTLSHFLHTQGFAVSVVNPIQARRYAEVFLQREKNDALDALILARMGKQVDLKLWTPPPPIYEELQQRVLQRAALVKMHALTINRQKSRQYRITSIPAVDARSKELMRLLKRQIGQIEKEFEVILAQDPAWANTARRITTIPGVGIATATWLIMLTLNFTTCDSPQQLASFIGLVPHRRQSGTSLNIQGSIGHVGHDDVRHHLYVATMSALRYNPLIRAYYDQVKARRKSHRLACIAAARKLLHMIWAIAKSDRVFDPKYASKNAKPPQSQMGPPSCSTRSMPKAAPRSR